VIAERINYLDHVTRGRVMFGVGPGALPADAVMQGISIGDLRRRMDEAIGVLEPLLRGEVVNAESDWFTLKDARLQMVPWSQPRVEMAVASLVSPSGAVAAGKHGLGLLSIQALGAQAMETLPQNWAMCEETAARHGKQVSRADWRLVAQMHLAETREQAVRDCHFGFAQWVSYFRDVATLPMIPEGLADEDLIQTYRESNAAVIGTPDDAIAAIEALQETTGGFGCMMLLAHNWANSAATQASYELFARYVIPHFQQLNTNRAASLEWVKQNRAQMIKETTTAIEARFAQHAAEAGDGG
jgi:limonene 1,2-monooxygenase